MPSTSEVLRAGLVRPPQADAAVDAQRVARVELRRQIAGLERQLCDALVTAFTQAAPGALGGEPPAPGERRAGCPRVLSLGELEAVRDDLAARLSDARARLTELGDRQEAARALRERMLLEPGRHRFARVSSRELGEGGCGVYQVRPRLGLIGMLMGWWQVKLSSGCPLAT
ncbi:MAG TPA: hypothetical protein VGP78_10425 [Solirubrobacteraceae bacterium]|nr:hypothetical protein [Solirubrobacteraceae bacterium]